MLQTVVSSSYHTLLWDGSLGFSVVPAKVWPLKATPLVIPAICRYSYVIPEFANERLLIPDSVELCHGYPLLSLV